MAIIQAEHLSYTYPVVPGSEKTLVLDDINLEIEQGEAFALLGASGAGKTTLCLTLSGVIPHLVGGDMQGRVLVDGNDTRDTYPAAMVDTIGIIYQDPDSQLFSPTVEEEIAFGLENIGLEPQEISERIAWALGVVRLQEQRKMSPARLSGGQKQRVAIACSLALLPKILILDDPTSSLDPAGQSEVYATLEQLRRERQMTLIMAGTDAERVAGWVTRLALIDHGRILAYDDPGKLLTNKELVSAAGIFAPQVMELAWDFNTRCQASYSWLNKEQAEQDLRQRLSAGQSHA
ncbi:MAG: energy-coupling factor ABC transporter ATP-binding protein [Anaerolineae bacterium]